MITVRNEGVDIGGGRFGRFTIIYNLEQCYNLAVAYIREDCKVWIVLRSKQAIPRRPSHLRVYN